MPKLKLLLTQSFLSLIIHSCLLKLRHEEYIQLQNVIVNNLLLLLRILYYFTFIIFIIFYLLILLFLIITSIFLSNFY